MLAGVWSQLTAPKTRYTRGHITNPKEAQAAAEVDKLESSIRDIGVAMKGLDQTGDDRNTAPNQVYGTVRKAGFDALTGFCNLSQDGQVQALDVRSSYLGSGDHYTVTTRGDHREIHHAHLYEGSGSVFDIGPNTLEQHEWAIFDGNRVSYKKYDFFSDATP